MPLVMVMFFILYGLEFNVAYCNLMLFELEHTHFELLDFFAVLCHSSCINTYINIVVAGLPRSWKASEWSMSSWNLHHFRCFFGMFSRSFRAHMWVRLGGPSTKYARRDWPVPCLIYTYNTTPQQSNQALCLVAVQHHMLLWPPCILQLLHA